MPGEEYAPNHHLAPIISGLIAWFRGDGRALLRTVRRMYGLPALFCATSAFARASQARTTRMHETSGGPRAAHSRPRA